MANMDIDRLLTYLIDKQGPDLAAAVDASVLFEVCRQAQQVFESQPVLLELNPPVVVCGDIHGQYVDLLRIFHQLGYPPTANYLFLGDYVDRGTKNLETIALLFCYKIKYPRNFFLLRGNHETAAVNAVYGFRQEIQRRFGRNEHGPLWRMFNEAFSQMPVTAIIGGEEINFQTCQRKFSFLGRILCMHGGLSPHLETRKQLRKIPRGWHDPGENRLALDLLWSDPDPTIRGWRPSPRGCSYLFGNDVLLDSCRQLDIDLIVRAHQVVQDGYEINPTQRLITVFSAPNYCGEFDNAGAVMYVDQRLGCSFVQFRPKV
ncbi:unnamed protein product [Meloidogyne enterolobii]|uniref:Uncharacterized protein n=2 Tax=Meloidogyne enterolobii TaxID=390850 RepID=A0ACB0Z817_MELEN